MAHDVQRKVKFRGRLGPEGCAWLWTLVRGKRAVRGDGPLLRFTHPSSAAHHGGKACWLRPSPMAEENFGVRPARTCTMSAQDHGR